MKQKEPITDLFFYICHRIVIDNIGVIVKPTSNKNTDYYFKNSQTDVKNPIGACHLLQCEKKIDLLDKETDCISSFVKSYNVSTEEN
jgi:hypothetical protein